VAEEKKALTPAQLKIVNVLAALKVAAGGNVGFRGECPLCGKKLQILGPWGGKVTAKPWSDTGSGEGCGHTSEEIRQAANLSRDVFCDPGDTPKGVLPDVMPWNFTPKSEASRPYVRKAQIRQFMSDLPCVETVEQRGFYAAAARIAVEVLGVSGEELVHLSYKRQERSELPYPDDTPSEWSGYEKAVLDYLRQKEDEATKLAGAFAAGVQLKPFSAYAGGKTEWLVEGVLVKGRRASWAGCSSRSRPP
jgi:hypothetical protein